VPTIVAARVKNRRAAARSLRADNSTSNDLPVLVDRPVQVCPPAGQRNTAPLARNYLPGESPWRRQTTPSASGDATGPAASFTSTCRSHKLMALSVPAGATAIMMASAYNTGEFWHHRTPADSPAVVSGHDNAPRI
jgi:hypothetical protein